jgi:RNA 2',3'-cyclic 3'-phosphodiesterase
MIRLFVGLDLPPTVRNRLEDLQSGLPGARWEDPEDLHLTLRFIGEVEEHKAQEIDEALTQLNGTSFRMELRGIDYFGGRKPRVLYAAVPRNATLNHLAQKIETAMQRLDLEAETRKFTPHITLAYLTDPDPLRLADYIARNNLFATEAFPVETMILFSSHRGGAGPHYTAERSYPLR